MQLYNYTINHSRTDILPLGLTNMCFVHKRDASSELSLLQHTRRAALEEKTSISTTTVRGGLHSCNPTSSCWGKLLPSPTSCGGPAVRHVTVSGCPAAPPRTVRHVTDGRSPAEADGMCGHLPAVYTKHMYRASPSVLWLGWYFAQSHPAILSCVVRSKLMTDSKQRLVTMT